MIARNLRKWLQPLRNTPLHPQWLASYDTDRNLRQIARLLEGRILDIGCGNNSLQPHLTPQTQYIGLDYPTTVAKGYSGNADVFGDGQTLPFADNSFDSVVLLDVMEHLPKPDAAFSEAVRVTRPGGSIIVQTPFLYPLHDLPHDYQRWTIEGLRQYGALHNARIVSLKYRGQPTETAAILTNIALVKGALDSLRAPKPGAFLLPLIIIGIPLINLLGWLLARVLPNSDFMPYSYCAIFKT